MASPPCKNPQHCAWHQPGSSSRPAPELRCAHHRLDPVAAPISRDTGAGRSANRYQALHGGRRARACAAVSDFVNELISPLRMAATALYRELYDVELTGARGQQCLRTTLAVALAIVLALLLRVDAPWWAAISAFVSVQVTAPASIERGALRIVGTAIGAAIAVAMSPWLVEDHVALSLALFAAR